MVNFMGGKGGGINSEKTAVLYKKNWFDISQIFLDRFQIFHNIKGKKSFSSKQSACTNC